MAIIEDLGLSVVINIDGADAVEYDDPEPEPDRKYPDSTVVSKYIESKDDKEYQINCRVLPQHLWLSEADERLLSFHAHIDGACQARKSVRNYPNTRNHENGTVIQGSIIRPTGASSEVLRRFKFSAVTTGTGLRSYDMTYSIY